MFSIKRSESTSKKAFSLSFGGVIVGLLLTLSACGGSTQAATPPPTASNSNSNLPIVALKGYHVSLFASKTSAYSNPDSLVVDNNHVLIDYQNVTPKTGGGHSTVVEYSMDGKVMKTFQVPGHSDGMRADPTTHKIWTTSNEDGNPTMAVIDPASGSITPYTFPSPTPHGGGYDDLYFLNGKTYIAASNPSLDKNGMNTQPAVDEITLSGSKAVLKPILMGNAMATDAVSKAKAPLTLTDPDSLSTDSNGNLVLIGQADNSIVTIKNPGTPQQSVTRLAVGTQLDDTVWATSATGRLLVADGAGNTYWIIGPFKAGNIYTQTPSDSTVASLVGQIDPSTGTMTTFAIGFSKPTGMIFVDK